MRLNEKQLQEAVRMQQEGKSIGQIAYRYHVHEGTMRRYMRNYERYGASLWTAYPTDVADDARS